MPAPAAVAVFAGDHGVLAEGVTPWPREVTAQMVANFAVAGAAINQIAKAAAAELCVVPIELERPTRDFTEAAAMSPDEFLEALGAGYRTVPDDCDLLAVGEMGIANTTVAATLCAALLGGSDTVYGEGGSDKIEGGGARDDLLGGDGADCLDGGAGGDDMKGEGGNDKLLAKDGTKDEVNGGQGPDKGRFDPRDDVRSVANTSFTGGC